MPAPADAVVTSPAVGTDTVPLTRGTDLVVSWQAGVAGTWLAVSLAQLDANGNSRKVVSCVFDAAAGSGTLPSVGAIAHLDTIDDATARPFPEFCRRGRRRVTFACTSSDDDATGYAVCICAPASGGSLTCPRTVDSDCSSGEKCNQEYDGDGGYTQVCSPRRDTGAAVCSSGTKCQGYAP